MPLAALVVVIPYEGAPLDEFEDWYETEHLPQRAALAGWLTGQLWMAADGTSLSLALYDLDGMGALETPEYLSLSGVAFSTAWTRRMRRLRARPSLRWEVEQLWPGGQLAPEGASSLVVSWITVPSEQADSWQREALATSMPSLAARKHVMSSRLFRARTPIEGDVDFICLVGLSRTALRPGLAMAGRPYALEAPEFGAGESRAFVPAFSHASSGAPRMPEFRRR